MERYRLAAVSGELTFAQREAALGIRRSKEGRTVLILKGQENLFEGIVPADLETIMVHLEAGVD